MLKQFELSNQTSCLNRAKNEEMIFVLLGRDPAAPGAIKEWCHLRIAHGKNKAGDGQIIDAMQCATSMEEYQMILKKVKESEARESNLEFEKRLKASVEDAIKILDDSRRKHASDCLVYSPKEFLPGCNCGATYDNRPINAAIRELRKMVPYA